MRVLQHWSDRVADATALAITTDAGIFVHSGDFKLDEDPRFTQIEGTLETNARLHLALGVVTLRVDVSGTGPDAVVTDVSYAAQGCSISVASSSVLAEEVTGHSVSEALETFEAMRAMLTSRGKVVGDETVIGDGVALSGVSKYPARVKCALLGWTAFTDALARSGVDISTTIDRTAFGSCATAWNRSGT